MCEHEMQIGVEAVAYGEIITNDESFDHEFGTKKQVGHSVKDFRVIVWLDGTQETDVTSTISEANLKYFKEKFLQDYIQKNVGAA